jgi:HTH-type transcriptional regulator / antitoxin HigA
LNLQTAYDLAHARQPSKDVARKARFQTAYPVREMMKRGWLVDGDAESLERQMASFFEVENANDVPHVLHAAKQSSLDEPPAAQLAWLCRARQLAKEIVTLQYKEKALRAALDKLQALMSAPEEARHVPRILGECGVRFVLVESLPGAKIDGVCFWLNKSPVIGMSCRLDRIDNFWFVLRHEIEHVLRRHGVDAAIIDAELEGERAGTGESVSDQERLANAAGADFCVPKAKLDSFIARKAPYISERDVLSFATLLRIHPGIAAGQVRWRQNNFTLFSKYLVKIRFAVASAAVVDGWGQIASITR